MDSASSEPVRITGPLCDNDSIRVDAARAAISRVLKSRSAVTADLSIRLGEALSLPPDFFSKAPLQHDL
jgi:plasmid maintenance system antidote protein VapI